MEHRIQTIVVTIGVFGLGALGAIWAQAFLMPFLSSHPSFQQWEFVQDWNNRTTIVREVREVVIRTDEQVQRVATRAENMVIGLESRSAQGVIGGSGFVVTSDGFLLTLASQVPQGYEVWVYLEEGADPVLAEVLKRDFQKNLAIVKINKRDLQTTGFADSVGVGDLVVLVAKSVEAGSLVTIVNQGSVRTRGKDIVRTNIFDKSTLGGGPLLNLEGNIVGLSTFESSGRLVAIPSSVLRAFSGF